MKNLIKKTISLIISLCVILCVVSVSGNAAESSGFCGDGIVWNFDDGTGVLEITGIGRIYDYTIYSPAPWYRFRNSITSVIINSGAVNIGDFAFYGLLNVDSFQIPDSVKEVGECSFEGTKWLNDTSEEFVLLNGILIKYNGNNTSIELPENVTGISGSAFSNNQSIKEISSQSYIDTVSSGAFSNCTSLQKVHFKSLRQLRNNVFSGCTSLEIIELPEKIDYIGSSCFEDTFWLMNNKEDFAFAGGILVSYNGKGGIVEIPDGVTGIADAFAFNDSVETVYIPDSVKYIGENAFNSCEELICVVFGNGVESIGKDAFYSCLTLPEVFFPSSLKKIDGNAFENCSSLLNIYMPEGLESIGNYAFASCSSVESIKLPNTLRSVGDYAFINCDCLTTVISDSRLTVFGLRSVGYSMMSTGIEKNKSTVLCGADNSMLHDYALDNIFSFRTDVCTHSMRSVHVSPSCDMYGYDYQKCTKCGYFEISGVSEPSAHVYSHWIDNGECFERSCSVCRQNEFDGMLYGDLDRNGIVNAMDSIIASAIAEGMIVADTKGIFPVAADCNRNGTLDENDIDMITKSGLYIEAINQNR